MRLIAGGKGKAMHSFMENSLKIPLFYAGTGNKNQSNSDTAVITDQAIVSTGGTDNAPMIARRLL